jgi:hypothetical protein
VVANHPPQYPGSEVVYRCPNPEFVFF